MTRLQPICLLALLAASAGSAWGQTASVITLSASPASPSTYGQAVTLTATLNLETSGSVTITFHDGTATLGSATTNSNNTATITTSSLSVGNHSLQATTPNPFNAGTYTSNTVSYTVNKAPTTTTVTSAPNASTYGQTVTITARVSPVGTGTVTFYDGNIALETTTANSDGTALCQTSTLAVGTHNLTAVYSGDADFGTSTARGITQTVNHAVTTTTLSSSLNPSNVGQNVTFTATVTGAGTGPTGNVTFYDGQVTIGTSGLNGNQIATFSTSSLAAGSHAISAAYVGDTNYNGSTSNTITQTVNRTSSPTTTSLTASPNPATSGQTVTLTATVTATVTPSNATGTVTFRDGTNTIGTATLSGGTATVTTASLTVGSHTLTASYGGDTSDTSSTSTPVTEVINKAATTTSLSASTNSATVGQNITLTATVSPSGATGTVTFVDGSTTLGTAPLSGGTASITTSSLAAGSHSLSATYSGDSNFNGSTSGAVGVAVGQGTSAISLTVAPPNANAGQLVTLSAIVTPTSATGTVTFKDSGATLGTVTLVSGIASFATSALTVGNHSLTAVYSGDSTYSTSTSNTIVEVINQATATTTTTLTVTPNPGTSGQLIALNAIVTPASATGTVTFLDGSNTITTVPLVSGTASFSTSVLTVGNHSLTAAYSGDNANSPSTSAAVTEVINAPTVTVTLAAAPNPANFGQAVTLTITVSPASSTGTVTVFDSVTAGNVGGTATLTSGSATITISTFKVGSHSLQAFYSGPGNLTGQSNLVTEVINAVPTTTTLTVSSNLLTATVSPAAATGTVTFKDGSTTLGTGTLSNGTATFTATTLTSGSHTLTATYSGDSTYAPSTSNPVTIAPGLTTTTTTLTASPASSTLGQTVTLTATVTPSTATGTVTFLDGSTTLGTGTLSAGTATLTTAKLTSGTHTLTASYGGDSSDSPSTSSAVTETVSLPATKTVLTASPNPSTVGQTVTLTATVTPSTATGTVTFLDGSTTLGTATLSGGTAALTSSKLTSGPHTLTASYGGDANNAPSVSAAVTETVSAGTPLQITATSIPTLFVGTAYTQTFAATGGTAPLTWIAGPNATPFVPGAVDGLTMSAAGVLSGTPVTAGSFTLAVRVTDSAGNSNAVVLGLTVNPAVPPINITVTQPTAITDQPAPTVSLGTGYPVALNGTYRLTFTSTPSLGAGYTAVQFVTGGTTSPTIAIPANSTTPVALPAVQLGTVAGTIAVQLTSLTIAGTGQSVPLPNPTPLVVIQVPRLTPIIVPGSVKITNVTSSGFQVILDASSTPRDLASGNFIFTAASGATLNGGSQNSEIVSLTGTATPWFDPGNATGVSNGGAFSLTVPFTFSGSTSALGTVSVTLTNSVGASAAVSGGQ